MTEHASAIERLIDAYEQATDDRKCADVTYFGKGREGIIKAARAEQAELVTALRPFANLCDGDLELVGGGTSLGFDGRLTAGMIKDAKALLSRYPDAKP